LFIWKIGLQMASQHPICGGGYEYFIRNYMYAQANYFHAHPHAHEIMLADNTRYAFNEGLHLLCNWGIIGCFLMAALLCSLCRNLKSAANLIPASMLAGLLVFSCFSYPSSRLSLSMFYLLLTASIVNNSSQQTGYTFTLPPTTQWGMRIFAMFGIIATTFLYSECRQANDLWHALRQKQTTPQELIAQTPYFIHEPEFQSRIGKACIQQKYYPETIRLLEKSAHLRPTVEMLCDLGTAYRKTGDKQKAEQCFQTAIDMIPSRMLARYRLFCLYRDNGETQKAQQTAQEILTQKAKVVNSVTLNIKQEARKYYEHINP
jgi:tetratricopeptide (TPR) repeat protein